MMEISLIGALVAASLSWAAGSWSARQINDQVLQTTQATPDYHNCNTSQDRVDACLEREVWLGDPNCGATMQAAVTAIGTRRVILRMPAGTYGIPADLTTPSNITLRMERGTILAIANSKTLTINGGMEADPYQIFSCSGPGKVVFGPGSIAAVFPEWWGAQGDEVTDDTAAIQSALTAGAGKAVCFSPAHRYKVISALTVSANTNLYSDKGAVIHQAAADAHLFNCPVSDVRFSGLKMTGVAVVLTDLYNQYCGINIPGTKTSIYNNIIVSDCDISGFQIGIGAPFTNLKAQDNYIHNVGAGIVGGHNTWTPAEQNLTGTLYYELVNNKIVCEFGTQTVSRPIALPLLTGGGLIQGNRLRGGGMSFEAVQDGTAPTDIKVLGNDCDTAISGGHIISDNIIDLNNAPVGRGIHPTYYTAIEPTTGCIIKGNTVRNYYGGIGNIATNCVIDGNIFISCGVAAPLADGIIYIQPNALSADTDFNTIIINNAFYGTKTQMDIAINWSIGTHQARGISIINNTSHNGESLFLGATQFQGQIRGNYVQDACTANNMITAFGIWLTGAKSKATIIDNTFVNTLTGSFGMCRGISHMPSDIVGTNKSIGLRDNNRPIDPSGR